MNIKLTLSYDGTHYLGWQKNKESPTIEGALEKALIQILQHEVVLQAASRTDAGVHAEGQVVNFYTHKELVPDHKNLCYLGSVKAPAVELAQGGPVLANTGPPCASSTSGLSRTLNSKDFRGRTLDLGRLRSSLNGLLPSDIRVSDAALMPEEFHPTLDNLGKEYIYQVCTAQVQLPFHRHHSWHFPYPIDLNALKEASSLLLGTHDFSAFCNERALWDRSPICTIEEIRIEQLPHGRFQILIRGDHFLYKMVRNLVGTLLYVGCGKMSAASLPKVLADKDRALAGVTAPANGLCLKKVFYREA